eukprot:TRINITY_DN781782_c0_g1_i1.p1 TRINITY_DN781782_c0_g1~~TRINITY_DN781782_c0_g1_i1.p1  ORF type:complete len:606 (-),score=119.36 TRINITY_DN781782_c0_g1_i1:105-1922(-)
MASNGLKNISSNNLSDEPIGDIEFDSEKPPLVRAGRILRYGTQILLNSDVYKGTFEKTVREGSGTYTFAGTSDEYTGEFHLNRFHGQGRLFKRDRIFEGTFENGNIMGKGTISTRSGMFLYKGDLVHGKPHGTGTWKYEDGTIYEGTWEMGKWRGSGKLTYPNGDVFSGDLVDGKKHGIGEFTFARNGGSYKGQYQHDRPHGNGERVWANGSRFKGSFQNGKTEGQGHYTGEDGSVIVGSFQNGKPHGRVLIKYANGNQYEGDVRKGVPFGKGLFLYSDKSFYKGEFLSLKVGAELIDELGKCTRVLFPDITGLQHGQGVRKWVSGQMYDGAWERGLPHGEGILRSPTGVEYKGSFVKGKREGRGICTYACGSGDTYVCPLFHYTHDARCSCTYDGEWFNDLWNGHGSFACSDGTSYNGQFLRGQRHGKGTQSLAPYHRISYISKMRYDGNWHKDKMHGEGKLTYSDGTSLEARYFSGVAHGSSLMTFAESGRTRECTLECGIRTQWGDILEGETKRTAEQVLKSFGLMMKGGIKSSKDQLKDKEKKLEEEEKRKEEEDALNSIPQEKRKGFEVWKNHKFWPPKRVNPRKKFVVKQKKLDFDFLF